MEGLLRVAVDNTTRTRHICICCAEGDAHTALRREMVRDKPDTPLHLVGIKNNVKLHMYGERREPWNDEGWVRLQGAETKYEQVRSPLTQEHEYHISVQCVYLCSYVLCIIQ